MFAPLNLSHVGTLDARQVRQRLLGEAVFGPCGPNHRTEG